MANRRTSDDGAGGGAAALHRVLQGCNLLEYEPLLLEEGADDVAQLKELEEEEFRQLCLMVGMASKPFHVKRLQKALGRPSSRIYSHKLVPASSSPSPSSATQCVVPPAPPQGNFSGATPPRPIVSAPLAVSQFQQVSRPLSSSSVVAQQKPTLLPTDTGVQATDVQKHYNRQQLPKQRPNINSSSSTDNYRVSTAVSSPSASPEKVNISAKDPAPSATTEHRSLDCLPSDTQETAESPTSKQLFLPPYLQPDSDVRDLSLLVDELTPIQAELGPCPFKPSDWDERRAELVRRYAAIYGQGNSKRKHEELSLHEENINMAAFQLCLRDPTLLVRRDELLILSRKAIKDGGYTFHHGISKAKSVTTSAPDQSTSLEPVDKESQEAMEIEARTAGFHSEGLTDSLLPLPRNMSREKKLKRVEELEFLIAKNKMKQGIKLTALEKARQSNDFSMAHHLQADIESLGNTLASLQEEYSNMKYRLRRSDRYFEKKRKMEEVMVQRMGQSPSASHQQSVSEAVRKRIRMTMMERKAQNGASQESVTEGGLEFYNHDVDWTQVGKGGGVKPRPPKKPSAIHTTSSVSCSANTTVSAHSQPSPTATSAEPLSLPLSIPHSSVSSSHSSPSLYGTEVAHDKSTSTDMAQVFSHEAHNFKKREVRVEESENGTSGLAQKKSGSEQHLAKKPKDLPSTQLLASINKLATQAAANLRSLPHL